MNFIIFILFPIASILAENGLVLNSTQENSTVRFRRCNQVETEKVDLNPGRTSNIPMTCLFIEAFFHLLTVSVYVIIWGKHKVYGKTLCCCALALLFRAFCMGASYLFSIAGNEDKMSNCFLIGVAAHYFTISSFTWLLLINIENWYIFSSFRVNGSVGRIRYVLYSLSGWGFPIFIVGISVLLDLIYPCPSSTVSPPEYGKVICFVAPSAHGYHVHGIISLLFAISLIFGGMTLKSQYKYRKETAGITVTQRVKTIFLFVKLSIVMGLTWAFGIIKWTLTKGDGLDHLEWLWILFDVYNALSGLLIFIIFVCRGTILNHLWNTHLMFRGLRPTREFQLVEQQ